MITARDHKRSIERRLAGIRGVRVAADPVELAAAELAFRARQIVAYVSYVDAPGGVLAERRTDDERLAALLDQAVAIAAADAGTLALELATKGAA